MAHDRPVALITGSARRIGAHIARSLHAAGYDLALHARHSRDAMEALVAEFDALRAGSAFAQYADLDDAAAPQRLVDGALARFGRLDALINNASTYHATPMGTVTGAHWDALFGSNARAPFFLSQAAAPHLAASPRTGGGAIVNIVDIYAERPLPRHPVYCMAKAALAMMTKSLALELGPQTRVNGIAPGNILWSDNPVKAETLDTVHSRTALGRQGSPDDIAGAVRFCLDSPYLTGQILAIDGGRTLHI